MLYRHKKTGNIYALMQCDIVNATNAQDGERMVMYRRIDDRAGTVFVREEREFHEKFEVDPSCAGTRRVDCRVDRLVD